MTPSRQTVSLKEAAELAALCVNRASAQWIPLDAALGRVLARDLMAPFPIPGEARSRMDGYAVRSADTRGASRRVPRELPTVETSFLAAGTDPTSELKPGTARRIFTGAVLPQGADAVVPDEDAESAGNVLKIHREVFPGDWVTLPGEQIETGETALRAGSFLTPGRIAAAAALGYALLPVIPRCQVAVASTGDELLELGTPQASGSSYADSRYFLAAFLRSIGAVPIHLGCIEDALSSLTVSLDRAPGDVVVTTGGTGHGAKDLILKAWSELEVVTVFQGVSMKPGGGTALGHRHGQVFWALPGSPWAVEVAFHELLMPMFRTWYGTQELIAPMFAAALRRELTWRGPAARAVPGYLFFHEGQVQFDPMPETSSNHLTFHAERNAYALLPPHAGKLSPGTPVTVRMRAGSSPESLVGH